MLSLVEASSESLLACHTACHMLRPRLCSMTTGVPPLLMLGLCIDTSLRPAKVCVTVHDWLHKVVRQHVRWHIQLGRNNVL
jgi:hypothetical protein